MKLSALENNEFRRYVNFCPITGILKNKTFLITGSKGLFGEGLIKFLLFLNYKNDLNLRIFASTRNPEKRMEYLDTFDPVVLCKFGNEESCVLENKIDYIIHCAAPTERQFFIDCPSETFRVIVDETERLLDLAKRSHVDSFLYLSSVEAYGSASSSDPINESYIGKVDQLNIRSGYPIGKKAAEFLVFSYFKEFGVPGKIVRPSSVQGLFQPYSEDRVYNQILRCMIENKNLVLNTKGQSKKSIIYSLDAITGILYILINGKSGEAYNLTNPSTFMTVAETASKVFQNFKPNLSIDYDIKPNSETGYLPPLCLLQDIGKIAKIGWAPHTDLIDIYRIDLERFKHENDCR